MAKASRKVVRKTPSWLLVCVPVTLMLGCVPMLTFSFSRRAAVNRTPTAGAPAPSSPREPSPPPATSAVPLAGAVDATVGLDLDDRYPAATAYWSRVDALGGRRSLPRAWWLEEMRDKWLAASSATRRAARRDDGSALPRIPQRLHQTWKDAAPPRVLFSPRWARSLREHNPGWPYRLWTDAENRELVASRYTHLLPLYDGYASPIQRADVARYLVADAHGGVYADLDTECFAPFEPLMPSGVSLLLSYKAGNNFSRGACNSIFGSAAGHPFWRVVVDVLTNRSATPLASGHTAVLYSTGPAVLREAIRRTLRLPTAATISGPMLALLRATLGVAVLDAAYLHPVTAERRTADDAASRPPQAVCTHHFVSSWCASLPQRPATTSSRSTRRPRRLATVSVRIPSAL